MNHPFENLNNESSSDTVNTGENENYNDKRSQKIINRYLEDEAYKKAMINYLVDGSLYYNHLLHCGRYSVNPT